MNLDHLLLIKSYQFVLVDWLNDEEEVENKFDYWIEQERVEANQEEEKEEKRDEVDAEEEDEDEDAEAETVNAVSEVKIATEPVVIAMKLMMVVNNFIVEMKCNRRRRSRQCT